MNFWAIIFMIFWAAAFFINNIFADNMRGLIVSSSIVGMLGVLYFNVEMLGDL